MLKDSFLLEESVLNQFVVLHEDKAMLGKYYIQKRSIPVEIERNKKDRKPLSNWPLLSFAMLKRNAFLSVGQYAQFLKYGHKGTELRATSFPEIGLWFVQLICDTAYSTEDHSKYMHICAFSPPFDLLQNWPSHPISQ